MAFLIPLLCMVKQFIDFLSWIQTQGSANDLHLIGFKEKIEVSISVVSDYYFS